MTEEQKLKFTYEEITNVIAKGPDYVSVCLAMHPNNPGIVALCFVDETGPKPALYYAMPLNLGQADILVRRLQSWQTGASQACGLIGAILSGESKGEKPS